MKTSQLQTWLYFIFFIVAFHLKAQPKLMHFENGCNYKHTILADDKYVTEPSKEAITIFNKLLDAAYMPHYSIKLKMGNVDNALATRDGNIKYILYSQEFISNIELNAKTKWAIYSLLAHEIGHHHYDHDFNETDPAKRKQMELEADNFSGQILNTLCASELEALAAISSLKKDEIGINYPPISARKEQILHGWNIKQKQWTESGNHPCAKGTTIDLKFGDQYKKNQSINVKAQV